MRIAVTGATGQLGGHIIDSLLKRGIPAADIVAIVRNEAKAAGLAARGVTVAVAPYEDAEALQQALTGVDRLVLVSGSEVGKRLAQHTNVINAARAAEVGFVAYTSLLNAPTSKLSLAPEHVATERLLAESGIDHTVLRNGWYWENYASALEPAKATGKMFGAAGDARVAAAARADYAEAAAVVVTGDGHVGMVYELGGTPALTYPEIAEAVGEAIGAEVDYVNESVAEYRAGLEGAGLPADLAGMIAEWDAAIADGALYSESTDLQDLIGRPATSATAALSA
ncbi:SDR family oxidoreductase [Granulicoccus phenolivorans]|uniref:SDR family oxidoreductase n=1 Tax=Granulicoccus phenolivorans TaxID=266854 RepID=UPI00042841C5|nr:SDR family oxidoreductase [Granulicoccus phenolivorans]